MDNLDVEEAKIITFVPEEAKQKNLTKKTTEDIEVSCILEEISNQKTPKKEIKEKYDKFNYVNKRYFKKHLNEHFPGRWSWIGSESIPFKIEHGWVLICGHLRIQWPDGRTQMFLGVGGHRITYKKDAPKNNEHIVNLGNDLKSASTEAFKKAVFELLDVANDVYDPDQPIVADKKTTNEMKNLLEKIEDKKLKEKYHKDILELKSANNGVFYQDDIEEMIESLKTSISFQ